MHLHFRVADILIAVFVLSNLLLLVTTRSALVAGIVGVIGIASFIIGRVAAKPIWAWSGSLQAISAVIVFYLCSTAYMISGFAHVVLHITVFGATQEEFTASDIRCRILDMPEIQFEQPGRVPDHAVVAETYCDEKGKAQVMFRCEASTRESCRESRTLLDPADRLYLEFSRGDVSLTYIPFKQIKDKYSNKGPFRIDYIAFLPAR